MRYLVLKIDNDPSDTHATEIREAMLPVMLRTLSILAGLMVVLGFAASIYQAEALRADINYSIAHPTCAAGAR